jgi:hypothetical protein
LEAITCSKLTFTADERVNGRLKDQSCPGDLFIPQESNCKCRVDCVVTVSTEAIQWCRKRSGSGFVLLTRHHRSSSERHRSMAAWCCCSRSASAWPGARLALDTRLTETAGFTRQPSVTTRLGHIGVKDLCEFTLFLASTRCYREQPRI